jgi:ribonuclease HI
LDSPGRLGHNQHAKRKECTVQIFTDGSKNEYGVGSGIAIYIQNKLTYQFKNKLHDRCSNNQAEQMAVVKALQAIETIKINDKS